MGVELGDVHDVDFAVAVYVTGKADGLRFTAVDAAAVLKLMTGGRRCLCAAHIAAGFTGVDDPPGLGAGGGLDGAFVAMTRGGEGLAVAHGAALGADVVYGDRLQTVGRTNYNGFSPAVAGCADGFFPGFGAGLAGVATHTGFGTSRLGRDGALVPAVPGCDDSFLIGVRAVFAGIAAHTGFGTGRLGGDSAVVPAVAQCRDGDDFNVTTGAAYIADHSVRGAGGSGNGCSIIPAVTQCRYGFNFDLAADGAGISETAFCGAGGGG